MLQHGRIYLCLHLGCFCFCSFRFVGLQIHWGGVALEVAAAERIYFGWIGQRDTVLKKWILSPWNDRQEQRIIFGKIVVIKVITSGLDHGVIKSVPTAADGPWSGFCSLKMEWNVEPPMLLNALPAPFFGADLLRWHGNFAAQLRRFHAAGR